MPKGDVFMAIWLSENIGTVVVCLIVAVIVAAVAIYMIKGKRKSKNGTSCGGGCSGCPMNGSCHGGKS